MKKTVVNRSYSQFVWPEQEQYLLASAQFSIVPKMVLVVEAALWKTRWRTYSSFEYETGCAYSQSIGRESARRLTQKWACRGKDVGGGVHEAVAKDTELRIGKEWSFQVLQFLARHRYVRWQNAMTAGAAVCKRSWQLLR